MKMECSFLFQPPPPTFYFALLLLFGMYNSFPIRLLSTSEENNKVISHLDQIFQAASILG